MYIKDKSNNNIINIIIIFVYRHLINDVDRSNYCI